MKILTRSAEETRRLGMKLGARLEGLDLICLYGTLGAGKTTFVQGLAKGMGFRGRVMSPTFGIARLYRAPKLTLHHVDLYRVDAHHTGDIGLEELVRDPGAACVIEWPDTGLAYLPKDRLELRLALAPAGARALMLKALGKRSKRLLEGFKA